MAGYDPKRPRPASDGDDAAPVEALLPEPSVDPVVPDSAPVHEEQHTESGTGTSDRSSGSPSPVRPVAPSAHPTTDPTTERHLRPVPNGDSVTPVADPPNEPTANRAVLLVGAVAAAALVVILLVRRRRR